MAQCWYNTDAPLALSPVQTDATMLDVTCCVRWLTLMRVVAQSFKLVKLLATCKRTQQVPTLLGKQWGGGGGLLPYKRLMGSAAGWGRIFTTGLTIMG